MGSEEQLAVVRLRRLSFGVLGLLVVSVAATGTTVAAFTSSSGNPGNTFAAVGSFPSPPPSFVKNLGTASCGTVSNILTVPASGVAAGNTVIARFAQRTGTTGAIAMTDSKGNTYLKDADVHQGSVRVAVFSAYVTTALVFGDTITVTHPSGGNAVGVVAAEFSDLPQSNRVDAVGTATGISATPSVTATTTSAPDLLYGAIASTNNRTYTESPGWTSVNHQALQCGGAARADNHGAALEVSSAGVQTYSPTMSTSGAWAAALVAYKRAVSCATPGAQTVPADRDTYVDQASPTVNFGADQTIYVQSELIKNRRVLVGFTLPSIPGGCSVTSATLRLAVDASVSRTIDVYRAAAAWIENGVTWVTQPTTTGAASSHTTTVQGLQYEEWNVTTQVQAWYSGAANDGFTVRDSVEDALSIQVQAVRSRENAAEEPELVVQWA